MSTKFTPGPWEWDGNVWDYDHDNEAPWLEGKDGRPVLSGKIKCSTEANAHLITAAPELYEALNDLLNDCINFDGGKLTDLFMEKASRALEKARGQI